MARARTVKSPPDVDEMVPDYAISRIPLALEEQQKVIEGRFRTLLQCLRNGLSERSACLEAELTTAQLQKRIADDPGFMQKMADAKVAAMEKAEEALYKRAVHGVKIPIVNKEGQTVAYRRQYSDDLLKFLLTANNPQKYGQRIQAEVNINLREVLAEARGRIIEQVKEPLPAPLPAVDDIFK